MTHWGAVAPWIQALYIFSLASSHKTDGHTITTIFLKDVPTVCLLVSVQQLMYTTVSCRGVQQQAQKRNSIHRTFCVASVQHPSLAFQLYAYHSTARVYVSIGVVTACRLRSAAEHFFCSSSVRGHSLFCIQFPSQRLTQL